MARPLGRGTGSDRAHLHDVCLVRSSVPYRAKQQLYSPSVGRTVGGLAGCNLSPGLNGGMSVVAGNGLGQVPDGAPGNPTCLTTAYGVEGVKPEKAKHVLDDIPDGLAPARGRLTEPSGHGSANWLGPGVWDGATHRRSIK